MEEPSQANEEVNALIEIRMQNIVATVNLGCVLDLQKIAQTARNAGGSIFLFFFYLLLHHKFFRV